MFPYGEYGWSTSIEHVGPRRTQSRNMVSLREYAAYRFAVRDRMHINDEEEEDGDSDDTDGVRGSVNDEWVSSRSSTTTSSSVRADGNNGGNNDGEENINTYIQCFEKLFQQFAIDYQVRIETQKLFYIRNHQNELRAASYAGLQDYLVAANRDGDDVDYKDAAHNAPNQPHNND